MSVLTMMLSPCRLTIRPVTISGRPSSTMMTAAYWSLITLLGSMIDSSRSRGAEAARDAGQVGPERAAFVVEAVAGEALGLAEQLAAAVEVAARQALLDEREQIRPPCTS